ncbi:MAG TPA: ATP synthase F0 subunit B [Thermoanaerobaculia bacterium]|nr:ATP synthase F0 subunit B [Thermoanaerobaculia bacterium]
MIKAPDVTFLYVVFAFLIAYAILRKYLFSPLAGILEQRELEEKTAARVHAESLEQLAKTVARAEQALSAARREALRQREALRAEGRAHLEKKLEDARAVAVAAVERGRSEIESQAAGLTAQLPQRAVELARSLAEKILGRKLAA